VLLSLGLVLLHLATTYEREGELVGVLLLPATYIRQHRVAGAQAGVRKERHHGLARRAQGFEGEGLAVEPREVEVRGRRAYRKALSSLMDGAAVLGRRYGAACGKARLQRIQAHQKPAVLPRQVEKEPPLPGQEKEHEDPA
jgi:hypothetical protein